MSQPAHGARVAPREQKPAPDHQAAAPVPPTNPATCTCPSGLPAPSHELLLRELDALLPAAAQLYGYGDDDIWCIRQAVAADRAGAAHELRLQVRQWRIDVIAAGLDVANLIGEAAAERARMQFRVDVMGVAHDESGNPYSQEQREWLVGGLGPAIAPAAPAPAEPMRSTTKPVAASPRART